MVTTARALPIVVTPTTNESWDSYLTRVAHAHDVSLQSVADTIGVRVGSQWPAFYGVVIDPATTRRAADRLGIDPAAVRSMQLSRYDGSVFDLTPLRVQRDITAARAVAARNWVYLAGSHYCPHCLDAHDGAWQLSWRLPWSTCCQTHRRLLVSRCPSCSAVPRTGRHLRTTRPTRTWLRHDGRRCTHPHAAAPSATCLNDLTRADAAAAADAQLALDWQLSRVIADGYGVVAGRRVPARECLTAWQAAACLAHAWRRPSGRDDWAVRKPWTSPPRDAALLADLLATASDIVQAPDTATAAAVLADWATKATGVAPTPATFADHGPPGTGLQPVIDTVLRRAGRAHSVLTRSLDHLDPQQRLQITELDVADIPQLIWPCALTEPLRHTSRPGANMIRFAVSLTLARIAGARDWGQAAESLGWTAAQGRQWARYVFRDSHGQRRQVIDAAIRVAPALAQQPHPRRWSRRPVTDGPTRLQLAAAQRPDCRRTDRDTDWCPCDRRPELEATR